MSAECVYLVETRFSEAIALHAWRPGEREREKREREERERRERERERERSFIDNQEVIEGRW